MQMSVCLRKQAENGICKSVQDTKVGGELHPVMCSSPPGGMRLFGQKSFPEKVCRIFLSYDELELLVAAVAVGDACHIASLLEVEVYAS